MPIHITVDRAADWAANRWIAYKEPQITDVRKEQILPVTKYNLLVTAFNASTVLLVMAVASAILFAYTAAVAFGAIAVFIRLTTEKEMNKFTLPLEHAAPPPPVDGQPAQAQRAGLRLWNRVRDAINDPMVLLRHVANVAPQREKEDNIFQRLGAQRPENWVENEIYIFDNPVWRNKVPVPENPLADQQPAAQFNQVDQVDQPEAQ